MKDLGANVVYPLEAPDASTALIYDDENISTVSGEFFNHCWRAGELPSGGDCACKLTFIEKRTRL